MTVYWKQGGDGHTFEETFVFSGPRSYIPLQYLIINKKKRQDIYPVAFVICGMLQEISVLS